MPNAVTSTARRRFWHWRSDEPLPTILYLHLPKAAGTTLATILAHNVRRRNILTIQNTRTAMDELLSLPEARRERLQLIRGHYAYGLHAPLRKPFEYITMLRNPVDRLISQYYYVLRTPDHYLHNRVTSEKMSLKDYAFSRLAREIDNGQCRFLSGNFYRDPIGGCGPDLLEQAKENLRKFAIVGLAERFDDMVLLLQQRYRWKDVAYVSRNVTTTRPEIAQLPEDTIEAIKTVSALDMELYDFGAKLFEAAFARVETPPAHAGQFNAEGTENTECTEASDQR